MSTPRATRGGDFTHSARNRATAYNDFIFEKARAGVPVSAIANMVGCSVIDVRAVLGIVTPPPALVAVEREPEKAAEKRAAEARYEDRRRASKRMPRRARLIVEEVAKASGETVDDILYGPATQKLSAARNWTFAALYDTGAYSTLIIGGFVGGRDHATVIHGMAKHRALVGAAVRQEMAA